MAIASVSNAAQNGWQQFRLQQAERNATQAEQTAQSLKAQADDAQRVASQAESAARSLAVESDQADSTAIQARLGVTVLQNASTTVTRLSNVADQVVSRQQGAAPANPVAVPVAAAKTSTTGVVNTLGQLTGTTVNVTA